MADFHFEEVLGKREVRYGGSAEALVYYPKVDGVAADPDASSGKITITRGGTELVSAAAMTESEPTTGTWKLTYTLNASTTADWPLDEDYVAEVEFTVATVKHTDRFNFDVVRTPLPVLISDNDLKDLQPNLADLLVNLGGDSTARRFIAQAHSEMLDRIRSQGFRPGLVVARERLVNPCKHLALHYIWLALSRAQDDAAAGKAAHHWDRWQDLWAGLGQLKYDFADSGDAGSESHFVQPRWTL